MMDLFLNKYLLHFLTYVEKRSRLEAWGKLFISGREQPHKWVCCTPHLYPNWIWVISLIYCLIFTFPSNVRFLPPTWSPTSIYLKNKWGGEIREDQSYLIVTFFLEVFVPRKITPSCIHSHIKNYEFRIHLEKIIKWSLIPYDKKKHGKKLITCKWEFFRCHWLYKVRDYC